MADNSKRCRRHRRSVRVKKISIEDGGNEESMQPRQTYTRDEIVLCTYAALYDATQFGGAQTVHALTGRSLSSISMKIGNIAAMLDDEGIARNPSVTALTGTTTGQPARRTDWETVKTLVETPKADLQSTRRRIIDSRLAR